MPNERYGFRKDVSIGVSQFWIKESEPGRIRSVNVYSEPLEEFSSILPVDDTVGYVLVLDGEIRSLASLTDEEVISLPYNQEDLMDLRELEREYRENLREKTIK